MKTEQKIKFRNFQEYINHVYNGLLESTMEKERYITNSCDDGDDNRAGLSLNDLKDLVRQHKQFIIDKTMSVKKKFEALRSDPTVKPELLAYDKERIKAIRRQIKDILSSLNEFASVREGSLNAAISRTGAASMDASGDASPGRSPDELSGAINVIMNKIQSGQGLDSEEQAFLNNLSVREFTDILDRLHCDEADALITFLGGPSSF